MHKLLHVAKHWAMEPEVLKSLASNMEAFSYSKDTPLKNTRSVSIRDGTTVISVKGPITAQDNLFSFFFGGTPLNVFVKDFQKALRNDDVKALGVKEGAETERNRLSAIEEASLPGHEYLVAKAKSDPDMTAENLALQIVASEKSKGGDFLKAAKAAEDKLPEIKPSVAKTADENKVDPNAPVEDRAKAEWDKDPKLRAEFGDDFEAYLAFKKADENGQVKILNRK